MKLKENFIKAKGAVSCGALLINIPLQVQHLHYSGVTHSQGGCRQRHARLVQQKHRYMARVGPGRRRGVAILSVIILAQSSNMKQNSSGPFAELVLSKAINFLIVYSLHLLASGAFRFLLYALFLIYFGSGRVTI